MEVDYKTIVEANREYHNAHAGDYNEVTMKGNFHRVEEVFRKYQGNRFLDMGCGTGEQMKIAKKFFKEVYGTDVSEEMVALARGVSTNVFIRDIANTGFTENSVNFINCFSVLHHLFIQEPVIYEAYRLLDIGGVFYSDNDPNRAFYRLFKWWLIIRRKFIRKKSKYLSEDLKKLERYAEYHQEKGLDPNKLKKQFEVTGFREITIEYHYPETPDRFTKILMFVNRFLKWNSLYYYFSITAIK